MWKVIPHLEHEDSWVTIPAGKSITVNHKIGSDCDFAAADVGKYTFEPVATFRLGPAPSDIIQVRSTPAEINVIEVEGRASIEQTTPVCSDENKLNILAADLSDARALARAAANHVRSYPKSSQFTTYFGSSKRDNVWRLLNIVADGLPTSGVHK